MGKGLVERFGGEVPRELDQLITLPGVARKTANVVLGTAYGIPSGFVVDTHVKRVTWRLGLTDETDPEAIEQDLMGLFPQDQWIFLGHALIWHGRRVCHAHDPNCDHCGLAPVCIKRGVER
jgi:endonuclease-3